MEGGGEAIGEEEEGGREVGGDGCGCGCEMDDGTEAEGDEGMTGVDEVTDKGEHVINWMVMA